MSKQVTLSSGEIVHFKPWKHKAAKIFAQTLKQGVCYRRDLNTGEMERLEEIPANNFDLAYEAVLGIMISKIEKDGAEIPFSQAWLDELHPNDYALLEAAVYELKNASSKAGEKNP